MENHRVWPGTMPSESQTRPNEYISVAGSASAAMIYAVSWNPSRTASGSGFAFGTPSIIDGGVLAIGPVPYRLGACQDK